ncbi:MAG TPA: hypothetical protein DDW38_06750 [Psychrobacter sp.]|nr:hypothetical protein [Psychrobacter sp.]
MSVLANTGVAIINDVLSPATAKPLKENKERLGYLTFNIVFSIGHYYKKNSHLKKTTVYKRQLFKKWAKHGAIKPLKVVIMPIFQYI